MALLGKFVAHANDKSLADPARGLIDAVEMQDFPDGLVDVRHDFEEAEIFLAHIAEFEKMLGEKLHPCFPVGAAGLVEQHHRNDARLAGLHQRQHFEAFVHRAETAGEKREGVGFFHEV